MTEDFKRKLTAILSADVVGYSRLMGEDEAATVKTLETYKGVMSSLIKQHRGRVVDSPGDNLLAEFGSVVDAVQCAVSIQKELQTRNADLPENRRMEFRIGINLGDVIEEEDRIYGDGVNIAARLEALADPGGVCISKTAFDHIENKLPLGYEFLGDQTVKNIAKPVGAYRVLLDPRVTSVKDLARKKVIPFWGRKSILSLGVIVILAIAAVLYWNFYLRGLSFEPASVENMAYPLPEKPSIAVMLFRNMSGDPEQDYIGDGLSENITAALSKVGGMFVIARESMFVYKEKPTNVQKVAEELGVQYVLEGSVQKSGDRLRVTAQLIDALSGYHLWSETHDRKMQDLFDLQDEITKKIVVSLEVVLTRGQEAIIESRDTDNLEAWSKVAKGYNLWIKTIKEDNQQARKLFEDAVKLDPNYATAWAWIGWSHFLDYIYRWSDSPFDSLKHAQEAGQKALSINDQHPYVFNMQGSIHLFHKEYDKAIAKKNKAIAIDPNYYGAYNSLATTMKYLGRFEESIELEKKAMRLCPNYPVLFLITLGQDYTYLNRYDEAIAAYTQCIDHSRKTGSNPYAALLGLSMVYTEQGRDEDARAYMQEALNTNPDLSLRFIKVTNPFKNPAHLQRMLEAHRKAGMPEHTPGAVQEKPSIAVLPFDNLSSDPEQEYFALGVSEEILNSLCQIPNLTVIAKTSAFAFKDSNKKIKEIANELGVDHVIEGSVRKSGNTIRITAQLIKAEDESHLWSETYDKNLEVKELFAVQEDIANNIADKLKLTLEAFQLLGGTDNIEAYENYLIAKGQDNALLNPRETFESIIQTLNVAINLDPQFALAWAFKAYNHVALAANMPFSDANFEKKKAFEAAMKAIEIEPNLGTTYVTLCRIKYTENEWVEAGKHYQKALSLLDGSLSGDNGWLLQFNNEVGNFTRVHELLDQIARNDPLNYIPRGHHIVSRALLGDLKGAEEEYKICKEMVAENTWLDICISVVRLGFRNVSSPEDIVYSNLVYDAAKEFINSPEDGLSELRRLYNQDSNLTAVDLLSISYWAAYFGDSKFALEAFEKTTRTENNPAHHCIWFPIMKKARQLPRFKAFVSEIGLADYWKEYGWPDTGICRPVGEDDFECD